MREQPKRWLVGRPQAEMVVGARRERMLSVAPFEVRVQPVTGARAARS